MALKVGDAFGEGMIPKAGQQNAGNWTVILGPADIAISLPEFDCYRIVIAGGPPGSTFQVYVNNKLYDSVAPGDVNSWDPNNPMKLSNGDTVSFFWNVGTANYQPTVWMYFEQPKVL